MARTFNGNTDDITFGSITALNNLATMTVVSWIYSDNGNTSIPRICSKVAAAGTSGWDMQEFNTASNTQKLRLVRIYGTTSLDVRSAENAIAVNGWTLVAAVDNGANVAPQLFYGNETALITEEASYAVRTTPVGTLTSDSGNVLILGNDPNEGTARGYSGRIGMTAIFNTALTQAALRRLQRTPYSAWTGHANCQFLYVLGLGDRDRSRNLSGQGTIGGTSTVAGPRIPGPVFLYRPQIVVPAAAAGTTVTATTVGSMVWTGGAGTVSRSVAASPGAIVWTAIAGSVSRSVTGTAVGSIVWTGVAGSVTRTVTAATVGSMVYNGVAGTVTTGTTVTATTVGSIVWTGIAGTVSRTVTAAGVAGVVYTGTAGAVARVMTGTGVAGYVWTGVAGTISTATMTGPLCGTVSIRPQLAGAAVGAAQLGGTASSGPQLKATASVAVCG